jgi:hypothetical protein
LLTVGRFRCVLGGLRYALTLAEQDNFPAATDLITSVRRDDPTSPTTAIEP